MFSLCCKFSCVSLDSLLGSQALVVLQNVCTCGTCHAGQSKPAVSYLRLKFHICWDTTAGKCLLLNYTWWHDPAELSRLYEVYVLIKTFLGMRISICLNVDFFSLILYKLLFRFLLSIQTGLRMNIDAPDLKYWFSLLILQTF